MVVGVVGVVVHIPAGLVKWDWFRDCFTETRSAWGATQVLVASLSRHDNGWVVLGLGDPCEAEPGRCLEQGEQGRLEAQL